MRLQKHLLIEDTDTLIKILKRDCDEFLKDINAHWGGDWIYRGVNLTYDDNWDIKEPVVEKWLIKYKSYMKNRKPRLANISIHDMFNQAGKEIFGWPIRNGVATKGCTEEMECFGKPRIFLPIGNYKFVWAPGIVDFNFKLYDRISKMIDSDDNVKREAWMDLYFGRVYDDETMLSYKKIIYPLIKEYISKSYNEGHLGLAIRNKGEITFNCKEYYLALDNKPVMDAISKGGWLK